MDPWNIVACFVILALLSFIADCITSVFYRIKHFKEENKNGKG